MAASSSSTGNKSGSSAGGKQPGLTADQVAATFQRMRQEQRSLASTAANLEMEINEHSLVIDTLKDVVPSRKCFHLVGGVLVEMTVKEVLPTLISNKEQITKGIETINTKMQEKGQELREYRERYNIRFIGEGEAETQGQPASSSSNSEGGGSKSGAGVLVS